MSTSTSGMNASARRAASVGENASLCSATNNSTGAAIDRNCASVSGSGRTRLAVKPNAPSRSIRIRRSSSIAGMRKRRAARVRRAAGQPRRGDHRHSPEDEWPELDRCQARRIEECQRGDTRSGNARPGSARETRRTTCRPDARVRCPSPASVSSSHCRVVGRVLDCDLLFAASGIADGVDPDRDPSADARRRSPTMRARSRHCREGRQPACARRLPATGRRASFRDALSMSNDCGGSGHSSCQNSSSSITETLLLGGALPLAEVHSFFHGTGVP